MPPPLGFVNFSAAELANEAGGDPWKLNDELQLGQPAAINDLADAFHRAAGCVGEVEADFVSAKQKFEQGWSHNGSGHPINESAEVAQVTTQLNLQKPQIAAIAVDLETIAASLATAQRSSDAAIGALDATLHSIDDQITSANAAEQDTQALHDSAVGATKSALGNVQAIRDGHVAAMKSAESAMLAGTGYVSDVIDPIDGVPQDAASTEANDYKNNYLSADQALVNQASATGVATDESRAAAARLRDYATITDPTGTADTRRLAGERLNDHGMANVAGPLPVDTVLGGDARTRARARLHMQEVLESPNAFPGKPPLTPDQATQLLDQWEANGRTMVLNKFATELEQAGVSREGVAQALGEVQNGAAPSQFIRDAAAGLANYAGALGGGAQAHGGALPTGEHWGNAPVWTKTDVEALKGFGSKLGWAGTVVDVVSTGVGVAHGDPAGPAVAQLGGRTMGGIAGGWAAGALWGSLVGPEGTLIVGFLGGIAGGIAGDEFVKSALGG